MGEVRLSHFVYIVSYRGDGNDGNISRGSRCFRKPGCSIFHEQRLFVSVVWIGTALSLSFSLSLSLPPSLSLSLPLSFSVSPNGPNVSLKALLLVIFLTLAKNKS